MYQVQCILCIERHAGERSLTKRSISALVAPEVLANRATGFGWGSSEKLLSRKSSPKQCGRLQGSAWPWWRRQRGCDASSPCQTTRPSRSHRCWKPWVGHRQPPPEGTARLLANADEGPPGYSGVTVHGQGAKVMRRGCGLSRPDSGG